jgi:energy-coupling factor transporter ATP-binding protein EcfA2
MKKNSMDFWKDVEFSSLFSQNELSAYSIGLTPLFKAMFNKTSGHVSEFFQEGRVKEVEDDVEDVTKVESVNDRYQRFMVDKGGRLIYRNNRPGGDTTIYLWKDGIVEMSVSGNYVSLQALSHSQEFTEEIRDFFKTQWSPPDKSGHIYAIVRNGMNLGLNSIGNAGIPLVDGNYTKKVMNDYKYAIKDLNAESPSGRIVIMRGPAGTGKTHLIRAMLLQVPDAMFVLISPEVVTSLAGPELLPLLMSYRGGSTGPIILVLEDADRCLVARADENMSLIQSLLNLGDGILGSLLDIRIVATTNADELKMEPAIMRPGRLSKMLDVNHLDFETAHSIFVRLLPTTPLPEILQNDNPHNPLKMTLAEIYSLARQNGWSAAPRKIVEDDNDSDEMEDWDE